jgi:hypothetical protein
MKMNLPKSSARVLAGRRNRLLRGPLTEAGRQRLREAALRHQPWRFSTGPTSEAGKRNAAANGRYNQQGQLSVREARVEGKRARDLAAAAGTLWRDLLGRSEC